MTWRLPRPIRGILAFLVALVLGAYLVGFGMGMPELALLGVLSCVAFVMASRDASSS